ncbi:hypothetical protein D9615_008177 [Tricholomella constricta]|uniref:C2H2-type domain-containing protein n=1 Tax=Tricholomella constricta TaxID=117010 RepID=A0A8H5H371_9AGAR|nr:hypothetical protein D9615_008177 [Tricholomella constricta]
MSNSISKSSQKRAGPLSLQDIITTFHNGSLGSDVHPMVLEAVVQIVLSKPTEPETCPSEVSCASPDSVPSNTSAGNPYWHLTEETLHSREACSDLRPPPSKGYDTFWSNFQRNKAFSTPGTPSRCHTQNPTVIPTSSSPTPLSLSAQSYSNRRSLSSPIPVKASSPSPRRPNKRKASSLSDLVEDYPALANFIGVIPAHPNEKRVDPFPCNRCRKTVGGDISVVRRHLADYHKTSGKAVVARCIFPGCDKDIQAGHIGSHIFSHQALHRARCGLCGQGFSRPESVVQHIASGACRILKAVDMAEGSQRPRKQLRHI